jgi:nuclear cap-binding protein subunit 1
MNRDLAVVVEAITIIARGDIEVWTHQTQLHATRTYKADRSLPDEDDYDRRPQRRRYEEPLSAKVRKQFLAIAESPLKRVEDEMYSIAKTVCDNPEDEELRAAFYDLSLQLVVEQPFKIPFVAAVVLAINTMKSEVVEEVLKRAAERTNRAIALGEWREVKLLMKFLGSLQGLLEGEGVWIVLKDLMTKAVDLQTENNEEVSILLETAMPAGR